MEMKRCVHIAAYRRDGTLILDEVFSNQEWYDQTHKIIDSPQERMRLKVARIDGSQYDRNGQKTTSWHLTYGESGELAEEWVWRADGSVNHTQFKG